MTIKFFMLSSIFILSFSTIASAQVYDSEGNLDWDNWMSLDQRIGQYSAAMDGGGGFELPGGDLGSGGGIELPGLEEVLGETPVDGTIWDLFYRIGDIFWFLDHTEDSSTQNYQELICQIYYQQLEDSSMPLDDVELMERIYLLCED